MYIETPIVEPRASQHVTGPTIKDIVIEAAYKNGFDPETLLAIVRCESTFNPLARHHNINGTWDIGLWQLNDVHGISEAERLDPHKSTEYAMKLAKSKRGLRNWVCYK